MDIPIQNNVKGVMDLGGLVSGGLAPSGQGQIMGRQGLGDNNSPLVGKIRTLDSNRALVSL